MSGGESDLAPCVLRTIMTTQEYRHVHRQMGLCVSCTRKRSPQSKSYCEHHQVKAAQDAKQKRAERKAHGICSICTQPISPPSSILCSRHHTQYLTRSLRNYHQRKVLMTVLCPCGKRKISVHSPHQFCWICRMKQKG